MANEDIDNIVNWALNDEPVTPSDLTVRFFPLNEYPNDTILQKIRLVRTMADAAWSHPALHSEASRLERDWGALIGEARKRGILDDIDSVVFAANSGPSLPVETAPVPQPRTQPKPPQHKRWRCMVVGCNPILDEATAQQHRDHTGHRVSRWPVRSQEGHKRQKKRNRTGYYDKYNTGAKSAEARGFAGGIRGGYFHVAVHHPFEDVDETDGYFDNTDSYQGDNK